MEEAKDKVKEGGNIVAGLHCFEIEYNEIGIDVKYKGESICGVVDAPIKAFGLCKDGIPFLTLRIRSKV